MITTVKDREDKLRYLLNFAGISSAAYYIGIFFADMILFIVPTALIFILSYILQVDSFSSKAGKLIPVFLFFGIAFIPLTYLTGFMFTKADTAFKYNKLLMPLLTVIAMIPFIWIEKFGEKFAQLPFWLSPIFNFYTNLAYQLAEVNDPDKYVLGYSPMATNLLQIFQFFLFFSLTILIDYLMVNSFKGNDRNRESVVRN